MMVIPLKERIAAMREPGKKTRSGVKIAPGVQPSRSAAARYRKDLNMIITEMNKAVKEEILPLLKQQVRDSMEVGDVTASFILEINEIIKRISQPFLNMTPLAEVIATEMVERVAKINRKKFINNFNTALS